MLQTFSTKKQRDFRMVVDRHNQRVNDIHSHVHNMGTLHGYGIKQYSVSESGFWLDVPALGIDVSVVRRIAYLNPKTGDRQEWSHARGWYNHRQYVHDSKKSCHVGRTHFYTIDVNQYDIFEIPDSIEYLEIECEYGGTAGYGSNGWDDPGEAAMVELWDTTCAQTGFPMKFTDSQIEWIENHIAESDDAFPYDEPDDY